MKKKISLALIAIIIAFVATSCDTNAPTDPSKGGSYFVAEIYDVTFMSPEKAVSQLVKKGYEITYEYTISDNGVYSLEYEGEYGIYTMVILTDGHTTNQVMGEYNYCSLRDYQEWSKWLDKNISSDVIWEASIDGDYYDMNGLLTKSDYKKALNNYKLSDDSNLIEAYITKDIQFIIGIEDGYMFCDVINLKALGEDYY